ncbi:MAG: GTP cyclohydrolase MptA [Thermoplasmata archaeon]
MLDPDVQSRPAELRFKLTRVGVTGVKKPVHIRRPGRSDTLTADFDVFVDLPATMKGSHLSRNLEVVSEIVEESVQDPVPSLEDLCADIARRLLERHEYATYGEVASQAEYFLKRKTPLGKATTERYGLVARARVTRSSPLTVQKSVGVEVMGMTACPCAMETIRFRRAQEGKEPENGEPVITHNQRTVTRFLLEIPEGGDVEANDLIDMVEDSLSSPSYEILKRGDEAEVVERAHQEPRFVEDVVREILARLLKRYPDFPDEVQVWVRSESEESIHKHNAVAERVTTLGELRT